jgi:hypothetical protein
MAKTKSLLEQLKADAELIRMGPDSWSDKLRRINPSVMDDIDSLIDAWNAGDAAIRSKCPYMNTLATWLMRHVDGLPAKSEAIVRYIRTRANNGTKG